MWLYMRLLKLYENEHRLDKQNELKGREREREREK